VIQIDPAAVTLPEEPAPEPEQPAPEPAPVEPPQAVINVEPQVGPYFVAQPIQFDGGFSTAASPIVQYRWGFGDGSEPVTGMGVMYGYLAPGVYTVTLRVTDQSGQRNSTSVVIQVDAPVAQPQQQSQPEQEPRSAPEPAESPAPAPQSEPEPAPEPAPTEVPQEEPPPAEEGDGSDESSG
jgi:PKD repeat protein